MAWVKVADSSEVDEDRVNAFDAGARRILIFRTNAGLSALDGICTHETADLGLGFLTDGRITCPLHLSQFDIRTGEVYNPPAELPLASYPVKEEHGGVWVDLPQ